MSIELLSIVYYTVSIFYLCSSFVLLFFPYFIKKHIPILFPLLHSFDLSDRWNITHLFSVGTILFGTAVLLTYHTLLGLYLAIVFSVWEIYLAFALYLKKEEPLNAFLHLILHIAIIIFVGHIILSFYSDSLSNITATVINSFIF